MTKEALRGQRKENGAGQAELDATAEPTDEGLREWLAFRKRYEARAGRISFAEVS